MLEQRSFIDLRPTRAAAQKNKLDINSDGSVKVVKQSPGEDIYKVSFQTSIENITAIRLTALPDQDFN